MPTRLPPTRTAAATQVGRCAAEALAGVKLARKGRRHHRHRFGPGVACHRQATARAEQSGVVGRESGGGEGIRRGRCVAWGRQDERRSRSGMALDTTGKASVVPKPCGAGAGGVRVV